MQLKDILNTHPLLSDRTRLAILTTLAASEEPIDFTAMLGILPLTRGNLSVHAGKLEEAGLISIRKKFVGKTPQTNYEITAKGRRALIDYLENIEKILRKNLGKKGGV